MNKLSSLSFPGKGLFQLLFLILFSIVRVNAQVEVSVPFNDGFIGEIGTNTQQANNIQRFSTLNISKASFVQTTNSGRFELSQGNDILGTLRLQLTNGKKIDMAGSLVWRVNSGNTNQLLGFLANSSVSLNLSSYGGPNYLIQGGTATGKSNFGFKLNGTNLSLPATGGSLSGNAATGSSALANLNAYLDSYPRVISPNPANFTLNTANQDPGDFSIAGFNANDVVLLSIGLVNPPAGATFSLSTTTGLTRSTGYTSWTGLTRISFTGTPANINNALASLSVATGNNAGDIKISVSAAVNEAGVFFNPVNGHFYKPVTWPNSGRSGGGSVYTQILADAQALTYKGAQGYLVTITSATEDNFVSRNTTATNVLIGLSDKDQEGVFKWDSGPEAGTVIRNSSGAVSGKYNNWCGGEPNNWGSGENYVVTNWNGGTCWNDFGPPATNFPGSISSYIVEFGTWSDPDDNAFLDFYSASTTYVANCPTSQTPAAPTISSEGTRTGSGTVQLVATVPAGMTVDWYASASGGSVLEGGQGVTTFTTPVISSTTTYYAQTRNVSAGCLSTTRTAFTAAVNIVKVPGTPTITSISTSNGTATVNFTAPDSDGGSAITNYEYSTDNGATWVTVSPASTTSPITITGLNSGANYFVKIRAVNAIGSGEASNAVSTDPTCNSFNSNDFQSNGNATYANNVYTLTPDLGAQNGSVWNKNRVYLDRDFDYSTKVYLGSNDGGADGIAFVLQDQSLNAGSSGGGLGYAGISPSFAVEFDTYNNGGHEPAQDHIAIIANGLASGAHNTYSTPYEVQMEDGQWHTARFVWSATTKNFQVWYDGVKRHDITIDLKADIFSNKPYVYWGFTGATGGAKNLQQVEFQSYCYVQQVGVTALPGTNNTDAALTFCAGASVNLQASLSDSYQWFKGGVAISGATSRVLEVTEAGSYTVESVKSSITTLSEAVAVTVNQAPVVSYTTPLSFLRNEAIATVIPSSTGAAVVSYTISPSLPQGLSFSYNGRISGTPTVVSEATTYTVTTSTAAGCSSTTTFVLDVSNAVPPSSLSYTPSSQTVRSGTAITEMLPSSSGGAVVSYTISPALPSGIILNASNGRISGTSTQTLSGSITYIITATNTGGSTTAEITLIFNTAPTGVSLSPATIAENEATGKVVGTLTTTDEDSGDTHTYTLVSGTGSTDNAKFTINGNQLKAAESFDFETKSSYTVRIKTTDAGGLSFEKAVVITVVDINDAPTDITLSPAVIYENNAVGAVIGSLSSADQDAGDRHTYTLISGDVAAFRIVGNQLLANTSYIFAKKNSYSIVVNTTDAGGLTLNKSLTIRILEEPVFRAVVNLPRNNQISADGKNVVISKGYSANLSISGSNLVRYEWSPSTGLSATNIANPIAKPNQTTNYTVMVTNAQGISTKINITVTVLDDYNITPNNILSPDGDGVNDFWIIENLESYPNNEVKIFDKSGRVIFNVRNYQNNWNGQLNGSVLHEGAYYYIINLGSGTRPKVGYITLFSNK